MIDKICLINWTLDAHHAKLIVEKAKGNMNLESSEIFHERGVALGGYDVVAYYKDRVARKGRLDLVHSWKGLEWWFSSEEYLGLFKASPETYLPEYGGFCAFGASQGYKAATKPYAFHLEGDKLYFNFARYVQKRWMETKSEKIKHADLTWDEVKSTVPIKASPMLIWWKYKFLKFFGKDLFE